MTKLIKRFKSVHVLGEDYNNKVFCSEKGVGDKDRMECAIESNK